MTDSSNSSSLSGEGGEAALSVDHALLESLFYDEMMLMDSDSNKLISSSLLSTLAADGTVQNQDYYRQQQYQQQQQQQIHPGQAAVQQLEPESNFSTPADATTLAEKALLQDFGVPSFHTTTSSRHFSIPNPLGDQQSGISSASSAVALGPGAAAVPSPLSLYATNAERPAVVSSVSTLPPPHAAVQMTAVETTLPPPFVGTTKSTITMRQQPHLLMMQSSTSEAPKQSPVPPPGYAPHMQQQHSAPITAASMGTAPFYSTPSTAPPGATSVPLYSGHVAHHHAYGAPQYVGALYSADAAGATMTRYQHHHHQQPIPAMAPGPVMTAAAPSTTPNGAYHHHHHHHHLDSEEEKRTKLVSQFATLASRLGINLPPQILQSLTGSTTAATAYSTGAAATTTTVKPATTSSNPELHVSAPPHVSLAPASQAAAAAAAIAPVVPPPQSFTVTPEVQELATTAEAAIAAVTSSTSSSRKRSLDDNGTQEQQANESSPDNTGAGVASTEKQPAHSKRRKKPTLSDCEVKLQNLKAENAMLKRHLANVSSKSHLLDQDRISQAKQMREMLQKSTQEGASAADQKALEKKLNVAVQNFTEMYSDYGRRRHHELSFHLEQLQRLANPTNFTKMGLWTLGQQSKDSRNPLAGILQKELGITAQQGKKILDQREKIRNCCSNLKECIVLLGKLKDLCEQKTRIFHDRIEKCREILTPRQVVKLLIWIDDHSELLDKACPGWGSEQIIHAKKGAPTK